jgi:histidinol-phosphate aminotransferase
VARIGRARSLIADVALVNGLVPIASATNFVAIDLKRDGAFAKAVLDGVLARDVFIRKPGVAPLDRCIRVSCSVDVDIELFASVLPDALAEARDR